MAKHTDLHPTPWAILPYYGGSHDDFNVIGAANRAIYVPCYVPIAVTLTGIRLRVGTQNGNICVGLYDSSGTRVATSGSVACPAAGLQTVAFTANYSAAAGRYYLALSASGNTATFSTTGSGTAMPASVRYQETAHPLPASATFAGDASMTVNLVGLISGSYPS